MTSGPTIAADSDAARASADLVVDFFRVVLGPAHGTGELDHYLAESFVDHDPAGGDAGRSGVAAKLDALWSALPDACYVLDTVVAAGDLVATTARLVREESVTAPRFEVAFADRYRVLGRRIVEHWHVVDTVALAAAFGAR